MLKGDQTNFRQMQFCGGDLRRENENLILDSKLLERSNISTIDGLAIARLVPWVLVVDLLIHHQHHSVSLHSTAIFLSTDQPVSECGGIYSC